MALKYLIRFIFFESPDYKSNVVKTRIIGLILRYQHFPFFFDIFLDYKLSISHSPCPLVEVHEMWTSLNLP